MKKLIKGWIDAGKPASSFCLGTKYIWLSNLSSCMRSIVLVHSSAAPVVVLKEKCPTNMKN